MAKDREILEKIHHNQPLTDEDLEQVKLGNQIVLYGSPDSTTLLHQIITWHRDYMLSRIDGKALSYMLSHFKDSSGRTVIWELIDHMFNQEQQPSYYKDEFCFLIENGVPTEAVKRQYSWFHDLLEVLEECETLANTHHPEISSGSGPSTIGLGEEDLPSTSTDHSEHETGPDVPPTTLVPPPTGEAHFTNHSVHEAGPTTYLPVLPITDVPPAGAAPPTSMMWYS